MRAAALLVVLAACTDNTGGGGGSDVTTHVITFDVPATPNIYCFDQALADVDPSTPGPQYECSVSYFTSYGQPNQVETLLHPCSGTGPPTMRCWEIVIDANNCFGPDHLSMDIGGPVLPDAGDHVVAQCVAAGA